MSITNFNDFIRCSSAYGMHNEPIYLDQQSSSVSFNNSLHIVRGYTRALPTPSASVVSLIPTLLTAHCSTYCTIFVAKLTNFGSINIGTNVFTDGSTMGTGTRMGVSSANLFGPILLEVTTSLNTFPGNLTIDYTDQDGNAQTGTSQALGGSMNAGNCGFYTITSTGVRDVTNITQSGGTTPSGVVKAWGVTPIGFVSGGAGTATGVTDLITDMFAPLRLSASDTIGIFTIASASTARGVTGHISYVGEDNSSATSSEVD